MNTFFFPSMLTGVLIDSETLLPITFSHSRVGESDCMANFENLIMTLKFKKEVIVSLLLY